MEAVDMAEAVAMEVGVAMVEVADTAEVLQEDTEVKGVVMAEVLGDTVVVVVVIEVVQEVMEEIVVVAMEEVVEGTAEVLVAVLGTTIQGKNLERLNGMSTL